VCKEQQEFKHIKWVLLKNSIDLNPEPCALRDKAFLAAPQKKRYMKAKKNYEPFLNKKQGEKRRKNSSIRGWRKPKRRTTNFSMPSSKHLKTGRKRYSII
jgi:hypothetical protein